MSARHERLLDLLAERAVAGLSEAEENELRTLLAEHPEVSEDSFELAAAALDLAELTEAPEAPPESLDRRLAEVAGHWEAAAEAKAGTTAPAPAPPKIQATPPPKPAARLAWLAAAAALILALFGWWPRLVETPDPVAPPEPTLAERLAEASDTLVIPWTATEDPAAAGVEGEVRWSNRLQLGSMRFTGLPQNDPREYQYQLWIFDKEQDERYPVDGGVFDVGPDGEVVIPIDAKIAIREPTLFAITIEKPGGVVVSSRERLVTVAAVG